MSKSEVNAWITKNIKLGEEKISAVKFITKMGNEIHRDNL